MSNSKLIIGIHGLSNKPAEKTLANWWVKSMLEGLQVNCKLARESLDFESVYWAKDLYQKPDPEPDKYRKAKKGDLKHYQEGWTDYLREKLFDFGGDVLDSMKQMYGMDALAEKVLKSKLKDLYKYYEQKNTRQKLRDRLRNTILDNRDKRLMVVAHSMGTIIAYDVLRELGSEDANLNIEHFVTMGSPLGLPHVKHKIIEENRLVRTPSVVNKWTNLADRRDPVALDIHLSDDYEANYAGVQVKDDLVMNDWGGINHKSYGYLRTPEFSNLLKNFI